MPAEIPVALKPRPRGHDWSEWTATDDPDTEIRYCHRCGLTEDRERQTSETEHTHLWGDWIEEAPSTCTERGYHYRVCSICGPKEWDRIPLIPHPFGEWHVVEEPTTEHGGTLERVCSMCGLVEQQDLPPLEEDPTTDNYGSTQEPELALSMWQISPDAAPYSSGDSVELGFTVTNVGAVAVNFKALWMEENSILLFGGSPCYITDVLLAPNGGHYTSTITVTFNDQDAERGHAYRGFDASNIASYGIPGYYSNPVEFDFPMADPGNVDFSWNVPDDTSISVYKSVLSTPAEPEGFQVGETISYAVTVTNNGPDRVEIEEVVDPLIGTEILDILLVPGESTTCYFQYVVPEDAWNCDWLSNQAYTIYKQPTAREKETVYSNTVTVPLYRESSEHFPIPTVIKQCESAPANGLFFVPGELVAFGFYVQNEEQERFYHVEVSDMTPEGIPVLVGTADSLSPGEELYFQYWYTVTEFDAELGYASDYAIVKAYPESDPDCSSDNFSSFVTIPCGFADDSQAYELTLEKTVVNVPANGSYFVEGETIDYLIEITNHSTNPESVTIEVYDLLFADGMNYKMSSFAPQSIGCGETIALHFYYTMTAEDCQTGYILNQAGAHYVALSEGMFLSNMVLIPLLDIYGEEWFEDMDGINWDQWQSEWDKLESEWGNWQPIAGEQPPFLSNSGLAGDDCCYVLLTGVAAAGDTYRVHTCDTHTGLTTREEYMEAINTLYDELLNLAVGETKLTIAEEKALFMTQLALHEMVLTTTDTVNADLAAQYSLKQLKDKCVELCYVLHNAPFSRFDSYVSGASATSPSAVSAVCACEQSALDENNTQVIITYCEEHNLRRTQLLTKLQQTESTQQARCMAFQSAQQLWISALNGQYNTWYRAADAQYRALIAQERNTYSVWLEKERRLLEYLYPSREGIAAEVLSNMIRDRVLNMDEVLGADK